MSGFDVVTRGDVLESALQARDYLVKCGVPAALAAKDPRLWGRRTVDRGRMGWLDLPFSSEELLGQIENLVTEVRYSGLDHIVLVGLGAEGAAAQAIVEASGELEGIGELTVLDGGDSAALAAALDRLDRTLVVLSSKAGISIEGDAYRRIFVQAFREYGLSEREIAGRFLAITDHDSPLDGFARHCGYRLGLTDPDIPGHYAALSAYGLVPAMLAGAQVAPLLEESASVLPSLGKDEDNPGLLLGAILGGCAQRPAPAQPGDKVVLKEAGGRSALTDWVSQLLATGTGKHGRGILPVDPAGVPPGATAGSGPNGSSGGPGSCPDLHTIAINPPSRGLTEADSSLWAPLGAQFLLWEYATTVAGWLIGVNPFESGTDLVLQAEDDAATLLRRAGGAPMPNGEPTFVEEGIEVYASPDMQSAGDLSATLATLLRHIRPAGYLSVVTYLSGDFSGRYLAPGLARRTLRPVTYGPGPGYVHSTGGYHKTGPRSGVFLVVTGDSIGDQPVPGRPYSLGDLQLARALADVRALRRNGLPVLWLHLRDPLQGAARLIDLVRESR